MASTRKTIKLYWCTTDDHDQDWFIFADSARSAQSYHEDYEGYDQGDAHSRLLVSNVSLKEFQNGISPCHAQFEDLFEIGLQNAGTSPNQRRAGWNGEIFREGILEAIIELGRQQLAVTLQENGGLELEKTTASAPAPDSATGVETGLRLVN